MILDKNKCVLVLFYRMCVLFLFFYYLSFLISFLFLFFIFIILFYFYFAWKDVCVLVCNNIAHNFELKPLDQFNMIPAVR